MRSTRRGRSGKRGLSPFPLTGKRFLLVRASRGREVLAQRLTAAGAQVEQIAVYTSARRGAAQRRGCGEASPRPGRLGDGHQFRHPQLELAKLFGEDYNRAKLASISPITSDVLRELGYQAAAEAAEYTLAGLTAAIAAKP